MCATLLAAEMATVEVPVELPVNVVTHINVWTR
jgi:hypothetical protein